MLGLRYCNTQLLVIQNFWYSHTPFLKIEYKTRADHASIIDSRSVEQLKVTLMVYDA